MNEIAFCFANQPQGLVTIFQMVIRKKLYRDMHEIPRGLEEEGKLSFRGVG